MYHDMESGSPEYDKICANCGRGTSLFSGDAVLCEKRGLVKPRASCRSFKYDPLKRKIKPLPKLPSLALSAEDMAELSLL